MERNRANNRLQRRLHSIKRRAIKVFREPVVGPTHDREKRNVLERLRTRAWTLVHTD